MTKYVLVTYETDPDVEYLDPQGPYQEYLDEIKDGIRTVFYLPHRVRIESDPNVTEQAFLDFVTSESLYHSHKYISEKEAHKWLKRLDSVSP